MCLLAFAPCLSATGTYIVALESVLLRADGNFPHFVSLYMMWSFHSGLWSCLAPATIAVLISGTTMYQYSMAHVYCCYAFCLLALSPDEGAQAPKACKLLIHSLTKRKLV